MLFGPSIGRFTKAPSVPYIWVNPIAGSTRQCPALWWLAPPRRVGPMLGLSSLKAAIQEFPFHPERPFAGARGGRQRRGLNRILVNSYFSREHPACLWLDSNICYLRYRYGFVCPIVHLDERISCRAWFVHAREEHSALHPSAIHDTLPPPKTCFGSVTQHHTSMRCACLRGSRMSTQTTA